MFVWALGVIGLLTFIYISERKYDRPEETVSMINTWQYTNGGSEREIKLPFKFRDQNGKRIRISTQLPAEFEASQTICFWTYYQDVEVELNGKKIYGTNPEDRFGKVAVSQWNYVEVPGNAAKQRLDIYMDTAYEGYDMVLSEVVFGDYDDIERWMLRTYGFNQIVDYVLLLSGMVFVLCAFLRNIDRRFRSCYVWFGLTAILLGLWQRISIKGIPFYWMGTTSAVLLGYLAFLLVPISLVLYVRSRVFLRPELSKASEVIAVGVSINVLAVFAMQAAGVRDIQENIMLGQITLSISVCWAMYVAVLFYVKARRKLAALTVIKAGLLIIIILAKLIEYYTNYTVTYTDIFARICILIVILIEFFMFYVYLEEKRREEERLQLENRNLHLQLLTNQIRPHFIMNTLGAIRSMIRSEPEQAGNLLYDFSKYIRMNLEQKDYSRPVPFLEELDYIDTFLNLETLRFGEKLNVEYDIQEDSFWILPLTVQPFVENAVKHGLLERKTGGTVWISTCKMDKNIIIEVRDDGVGFDTQEFGLKLEESKSVGMRSAIFRLQDEMKAKVEVQSTRNPECSGTCIRIILPEKEVFRNENNNCR